MMYYCPAFRVMSDASKFSFGDFCEDFGSELRRPCRSKHHLRHTLLPLHAAQ